VIFPPAEIISKIMHRRSTFVLGSLLALGLSAAPSFAQGEGDFLAGKTKACPSCTLERAGLKRRDLAERAFFARNSPAPT
jgi:hypothetical protein